VLRLPAFELAEPRTLGEAVALLTEHGEDAQLIAGGTDLVPNMKHELFTPRVVISLAHLAELRGVRIGPDGLLVIGAMTTLDELAQDPRVVKRAPALAQAAGLVAGPQLRRMGTLGGNVMLDTRCQWYNQTYFWRSALGFCLKKDGTLCHVVAGGANCVAAASNDSAPALMSLDGVCVFHGPRGRREIPIDALYTSDGIHNKNVRGEILVEVRVPPVPGGHRGAYGKLRERGSIDFPLLGVAARVDLDGSGAVGAAALCAVALQARPLRLAKAAQALVGTRPGTDGFRSALGEAGALAEKQCRPLENIPGDPEYRHAMVPVYVRRTVQAAVDRSGPVHHI
jgi:4-hydroxybenzoyl-CoA reductase subunit beta